MEEISAFAGTSKSVFYRYFNDKAGLQRAVGDVVLGQMQRRILEAAKTASSPRQGLLHMVTAYLEMAETSPNVYAFVTQSAVDVGPTTEGGALGDFFDDVIAMVADPMRIHLRQDSGPLVNYWPTAAIGLVRTAGELWLATPSSPLKPRATEMAEQITNWLFLGISAELPGPVDALSASQPVAQAPSPLPPHVPSPT
jgi:AcrR family transcriptional regulator